MRLFFHLLNDTNEGYKTYYSIIYSQMTRKEKVFVEVSSSVDLGQRNTNIIDSSTILLHIADRSVAHIIPDGIISLAIKTGDSLWSLFGDEWRTIYNSDLNVEFRKTFPDPSRISANYRIKAPTDNYDLNWVVKNTLSFHLLRYLYHQKKEGDLIFVRNGCLVNKKLYGSDFKEMRAEVKNGMLMAFYCPQALCENLPTNFEEVEPMSICHDFLIQTPTG